VRELENKLQRAWLFHSGKVITAADLGIEPSAGAASPAASPGAADEGAMPKTLEEAREAYESDLLRQCMRHFKGNITKCAEHLQISRNTCKSMLRKYKLVQDDGED
jgi:DNA-binding NtrC family response regulator